MMIPTQLQHPNNRFFLIGKDSKLPIESRWNSDNNYPFFHSKLQWHFERGGNYGICCGINKMIVIDFDSSPFYEYVRDKLPMTFTTLSALKKTPHYYYYLKDDMIKKKGIDAEVDLFGNIIHVIQHPHNYQKRHCENRISRVCDIQAWHSGVVCPNSKIKNNSYQAYHNYPITEITIQNLEKIFPEVMRSVESPRSYLFKKECDKESVIVTVEILKYHDISQHGIRHFKCPFHESNSKKCLWVTDDGGLYCFHCLRHYDTIYDFLDDYRRLKQ